MWRKYIHEREGKILEWYDISDISVFCSPFIISYTARASWIECDRAEARAGAWERKEY